MSKEKTTELTMAEKKALGLPDPVNWRELNADVSRIILDGRKSQIQEILSERPYEAMTLATKLLEEYEDDHDVMVLCLKTALDVETKTDKRAITEDLYQKAVAVAKDRFFSPEILCLSVIAKGMLGQTLLEEDISKLSGAFILDPDLTTCLLKKAKPILNEKNQVTISKIIGGCNENS